jgi:hypothetical protein
MDMRIDSNGATCRFFQDSKFVIVYDGRNNTNEVSKQPPTQFSEIVSDVMNIKLSVSKEIVGIDVKNKNYLEEWGNIIKKTNAVDFEDVIKLDERTNNLYITFKKNKVL